MSHCHSEHTHGHDHDGHDHSHDGHDHSDDITPALQNSLYDHIDFDKIVTLNEEEEGSGRAIVKKTWAERMEAEPELQSSADEQLLMTIPRNVAPEPSSFTGQASLHSIHLRTSPSASAPRTLKLFVNRGAELDFSTAAELAPAQSLALAQTAELQEVPVKRQFFNAAQSLTLFFEDNFGTAAAAAGDEEEEEVETRVSYVGLRGTFLRLNKEGVSVLYEAAANPADHKAIVGTEFGVGHDIDGGR